MPYIGNQHNVGDHVNNFKVLDDISSHTATFDGSATSVVDTTNNTIRVPLHRFIQGQRVTYTNGGGGNIGGLTTGTAYFVSFDSANTIKLATTLANANSNTVINLSAVGSGTSHTLNVAFDGVNTKFKMTHGSGKAARLNNATQLNVAINNVIQRPNLDPNNFSDGFALQDNHKIVFNTAPVGNDVFWGSIIANTIENFDLRDNEVDNFTGDGSTTEFTLSTIPANNESVIVSINGVVQHPSDKNTNRSYTLINSIIQFTAAPALNDEIQVRHIGFAGASTNDVSGFYGRTGNVALTSSDHITTGDITSRNINSSGIITATTFDGAFSSSVGGSNANFTGIVTAGVFKGGDIEGRNLKITGLSTFVGDASFTGNVSIGGTLTYEDVTNIDSVGVITARSNIDCNGSLDVDGHTDLDNVSIAGVTTASGNITIENAEPSLFLTDTNGNPDYKIFNDQGAFKIYDTTYSATRLQIGPSNGEMTVQSNANFPNGITMNPGTASVVNTIAQRLGDTDTKIRFPANDTFTVETAGSERLRITSGGQLVIKKDAGSTNNAYSIATEFNAKTSGSAAANFGPALYLTSSFGGTTYAGTVIASQTNADVHTSDLVFYPRNYSVFEGLRLASNGRVGIRTDNPGRELDVFKGTNDCTIVARTRTAGAWFEANSEQSTGYYGLKLRHGNTEKWFLGSYGSNNLQLKTATANASSLMEVTSAGLIGIGTNNPSNALDVQAGTTNTAIVARSTDAKAQISLLDNSTTSVGSVVIGAEGDDLFLTSGSGGAEALRITSDGRVLIGRTSAYAHADADNLIVGNEATNEHQGITILSHSGKYGGIYFGDGAGTNPNNRCKIIYDHPNDQLRIGTGGAAATQFYINSSGYVGINQSPSARLDVKQDNGVAYNGRAQTISYGAARFHNTSGHVNGGTYTGFQFNITGDSQNRICAIGMISEASNSRASSLVFATDDNSNRTEKLRITSEGKVGINASIPETDLHVKGDGGYATNKAGMKSNAVLKLQPHASDSTNMLFSSVNSGNGIGVQVTNGPATANWDIALNPFGGKVGIGTDNPVTNLDVRGASDASITIGLNNGTKYGNFSCDNSATYLYGYNGNDIIFSTHSGNSFNRKVTIKNGGQVNIERKNNSTAPAGNGTFTDIGLDTDGGDIATGRIFLQGYQKSANSDFLTGINNEGASLVLYDYSNNHYKQKWHKNGGTELWYQSTNRLETTSGGVTITGNLQVDGSGTSVTIVPTDGLINFGMDGRSSLVTGTNACYIFSGSGSGGDMPAGSLVLQSRANVNRHILFATGTTPSLKWQIDGSTGALREYPYNTSTSSQSTGNGQAYHLRRVYNGQVPTGTSGNTYTLFNTNTIGDAGAYIIILRSFEQSVTGGVLWSVRVVSSVFYLHSGTGNDGETVKIPVTYSGHANNATTQSQNGDGPVTLRHAFYNGSAHTHGKITITFNGFSYSGSNCDYYVYKLIDV